VRWDAHELARVAEHAGFSGDDVRTAVAVALTTSGGIDHFRYRPGSPGSGDYRGLWGIDVDRFPHYHHVELDVPRLNAHVARALCRDHDGWHWSPWWQAGRWTAYVDHAGAARTRTYDGQQVSVPVTVNHTASRIADTLHRIRAGHTSGWLRTIDGS
jgi:hypothetical protein